MPAPDDDADHSVMPTSTASGVSTSVSHPTNSNTMTTNPTDHPDRPTKPTDTDTTGETEPTPTGDESPEETTETSSSWLPAFLPTFGASPHTAAWIYGSFALIVVFCAGLGAWLCVVRRRRLRNSQRSDYEFELLNDEEAEGLTGSGEKVGGAGAAGRKRRTRGGELYDAFADGSDDEEEFQDLEDDEDGISGSGSASGSGSGAYGDGREKLSSRGDGRRSSEDDEQHVIGDDSDYDEEYGRGNRDELVRR